MGLVGGSQQLAGQAVAEGLASLEEGLPVSQQGLDHLEHLGANTLQCPGYFHRHVGDALFNQDFLVGHLKNI